MPAGAPNPLIPADLQQPKNKGGRPPKYRPEFALTAGRLIDIMGATDQQLADYFEVSGASIWSWKLSHPEFAQATEISSERANRIMERSLFLRGTGYSHPAVKIFLPPGAKEPIYAPYTQHYPPDTGAAALWLNNRDPKRWKNRGAPPDDAPQPGAAQQAALERQEAFATIMAVVEDRIKKGLPPLFAKPQAQIIDQAPRPALPTNGKGNGHT